MFGDCTHEDEIRVLCMFILICPFCQQPNLNVLLEVSLDCCFFFCGGGGVVIILQ
jgi:hypothetical protein